MQGGAQVSDLILFQDQSVSTQVAHQDLQDQQIQMSSAICQ